MKNIIFKVQLLIACIITVLLGKYEYEFISYYMERVPDNFEKAAGIIAIIIMVSVCLTAFVGTMYLFEGLHAVFIGIKEEFKHKR